MEKNILKDSIYLIKMYTMYNSYEISIVASLFIYNGDKYLSFTKNGTIIFLLKNNSIKRLFLYLKKVCNINYIKPMICDIESYEDNKYSLPLTMKYIITNNIPYLKFLYKNKIKRFKLFGNSIFILYKFMEKYLNELEGAE